jgi:protein involved in temperature-dependent protein secretion
MIVKLYSFGAIRRGDWLIKVSAAFDQILVIAYHQTRYQSRVKCFRNEIEAVYYVETLLAGGADPSFSHDET